MPFAKAWVTPIGPLRLMARLRSQKSGAVFRKGPARSQPALLTSTSIGPQLGGERDRGSGVGYIQPMRGATDRRRDSASAVQVDVGHRDLAAFGGQAPGDRRADAPGPAGDYNELAAEPLTPPSPAPARPVWSGELA